jgi:outer membrane protein assembly factor BamB
MFKIQSGVKPDAFACKCWRFVGHDPGNSRHHPAACMPTEVLWRQKIEGLEGAFKPLAWQDMVVLTAITPSRKREGCRLLAFHPATGERIWAREFDSGDFYKAKKFPDRCIERGRLYITNGQACLVINPANGNIEKTFQPPAGAAGWGYLTAYGPNLYGASADGRALFAVNATSGKMVWCRNIAGSVHLPALTPRALYFHTDQGRVAALNLKNGKALWQVNPGTMQCLSQVYAAGPFVAVLCEADSVAVFEAKSGRTAWVRKIPGAFASGIALGETAMYVKGGTEAVDIASGKVLWQPAGEVHGVCAAPTVLQNIILSAAGRQAGLLNIMDLSGKPVDHVANAALQACDGAIVLRDRVYAIGFGHLLALGCARKG